MLIEFSVGNYLSIKDKQTLRMDASSITEYQDRLIDAGRYKLLRSAVIYGANASGKSNVLKALATMRQIITTSAAQSSTATIPVEPFLLSTETEHAPSYFEILFLIEGVRYRYGFEANHERVYAEWLFEAKKQHEKVLFVRELDAIEISKTFREGKGLEERTSNNKLFLSVCDQFNGEIVRKIIAWSTSWEITSGILHQTGRGRALAFFDNDSLKEKIDEIMKKLNTGITKILPLRDFIDTDNSENEIYNNNRQPKVVDLIAIHSKFDIKNKEVEPVAFSIDKESTGTNKVIDLLAPIIKCLILADLLIIDELDAKLHPLLTKEIINLFNNPETNSNNAQLIFATHDTNLLSYGQFRRDQIYFTEKDQYGATSLYSLVDYKEDDGSTVRKDRSFEKDYIQGRYGAIPYIGDFSKLFS